MDVEIVPGWIVGEVVERLAVPDLDVLAIPPLLLCASGLCRDVRWYHAWYDAAHQELSHCSQGAALGRSSRAVTPWTDASRGRACRARSQPQLSKLVHILQFSNLACGGSLRSVVRVTPQKKASPAVPREHDALVRQLDAALSEDEIRLVLASALRGSPTWPARIFSAGCHRKRRPR